MTAPEQTDVVVVGGGQAGLAVGFHLQRLGRHGGTTPAFVVLDDRAEPGGAWQDGWPSLELFSPAAYSSLPGWPMPSWPGPGNPPASHVRDYLAAYERRYDLPVRRPVRVSAVRHDGDRLLVEAEDGRRWATRVLVNATGTWRRPHWPAVPGMREFRGRQLHTADYRGPEWFRGRRVLVVGGGNSGAQVAADLLPVAGRLVWVTREPPSYLPDDVDGRVLFETATRHVRDVAAGRPSRGVASLGDIVAVPSVRRARDEGGLRAEPMVERLTATGARWPDGREEELDAVVWCTGFRPALGHLSRLHLPRAAGHPLTHEELRTEAHDDPRVFFVGYGDWCGPASATLIGVGRPARDTAARVARLLAAGGAAEPGGGWAAG